MLNAEGQYVLFVCEGVAEQHILTTLIERGELTIPADFIVPNQLRLALKTADTGERIRLLNGALQNTGNAIGQLAQFNADGTRRPPRREEPCPHYNVR